MTEQELKDMAAQKLGYIKLYRQIIENELYFSERFTKILAWIDILLSANHKPATIFIRGIEINLQPGELCYSQLTLAKRWKWNERTVKKFLKWLENRQMIHTRTTNITTIISILKWNEYQTNTEQNTEQLPTRIQTDKNVKNDKNKIYNLPPHSLQTFIKENCPRILKLTNQLTFSECEKLIKDYNEIQVQDVLLDMENYKPLLKNSMIYQIQLISTIF